MDTNIAPDRSFSVVIASTGRELTVPQGHTILDVLFDAGIDIPTSCEEGVCGTCRTRVLEGIPDHTLLHNDRDFDSMIDLLDLDVY